MAASRLPLLLFPLLLLAASCAAQEDSPRFRCSSAGARCQALAGYVVNNETTYEAIRALFQVNSTQDLYSFNNRSATTPASTRVSNGTLVRVPFPCACSSNGIGVADPAPVYTVASGDFLNKIATENFKGLISVNQIVAANTRITNPSMIEAGWRLQIPLPCSCDPVDGAQAVHLAYVVAKADSLEGIATRFGTTQATLSRINDISNPRDLRESPVLDVPLQGAASPPGSQPGSGSSPPGSGAHAVRPQLWGLPWSCTQPLLLLVAPLYSALLLLALL
ncbi:hypothetical protein Taro_017622, partial [Colocasia esculenta]|nr:hypothetical protein [Colocasia esculenta]